MHLPISVSHLDSDQDCIKNVTVEICREFLRENGIMSPQLCSAIAEAIELLYTYNTKYLFKKQEEPFQYIQ